MPCVPGQLTVRQPNHSFHHSEQIMSSQDTQSPKFTSLRMQVHYLLEKHHPIEVLEMMSLFAERRSMTRSLLGASDDRALDEFIGALDATIAAAGNLDWDDTDRSQGQFARRSNTQVQQCNCHNKPSH
jgi:hypothetical protein